MGKRVDSRVKGAAFERKVAGLLFEETGITFRRDLRQYQESGRGDLVPSDSAWPFLIECKAYASGGFQSSWWGQAHEAAEAAQKAAVVIWKINNKPISCRLQLQTAMACLSKDEWDVGDGHLIDMDISGLCYLARERMASSAVAASQAVEFRGQIT